MFHYVFLSTLFIMLILTTLPLNGCENQTNCQVPPPICDILHLQTAAANGDFKPILQAIYNNALQEGYELSYVLAYLNCTNNAQDACINLLIQAMQQATGYMTFLNYAVNPDGWENDAFWGQDCCDQENCSIYNTCPPPL